MEILQKERDNLIKDWNQQVKNQERNLDDLKQKQNKALSATRESYRKEMERLARDRKRLDTSSLPSGSVVIAPAGVRVLHDGAAENFGRESPKSEPTSNSGGTSTKTETFDATAFTQRLIDNINEYNALVIKYNALLDLILSWKELADGANTK